MVKKEPSSVEELLGDALGEWRDRHDARTLRRILLRVLSELDC